MQKTVVYRTLLLLTICFAYGVSLQATHNRAAEITYEQIGELTIRITITTYTKPSSPADRDSLTVCWGDGSESSAPRVNGNGDELPNDIKVNFYIAEHTYPGRATYKISFTDENRIGNILNIDPPNSINVPVHVSTTFTFLNPQFQGENNSAILLQPPIDFACVGQPFVHNPNAFDPDGDSLSYQLVIPFQDKDVLVPNYLFPDQIQPGPANNLSIDARDGTVTWDAPQADGEYNIAIQINEWRQNAGGQWILLNSIIRDMQILVDNCLNEPPVIEAIDEICIVAERETSFSVIADDSDRPRQAVRITALGGPFESMFSLATFDAPSNFTTPPVEGVFSWTPSCNDISEQFYSVVFKATDNFRDSTGLVDLHTTRIKVVGPSPEDLSVDISADGNRVSWANNYACENAENDFFKGFTVWRREGSNPFLIDTCNVDLAAQGYTRIAFNVNEQTNGRYFFVDENTVPNTFYCYRVTATFAETSAAGNPFNISESLPSNEDCAQQLLDRPRLTKVSVLSTDPTDGSVEINWSLPVYPDLDTTAFPGPYKIQLLHAVGFGNSAFSTIPSAEFDAPNFSSLADTSFTHTGINTRDEAHEYQLVFSSRNRTFEAEQASSIFLTVAPSDESTVLTWRAEVPWQNYLHRVFREIDGNFEFIGQSSSGSFTDTGLENGVEYCYFIESEGTYGFDGIVNPILNLSQIDCAVPEDVVAPCRPSLTINNNCNGADAIQDQFTNAVRWSLDAPDCNLSEIAGYRLYFIPFDSTNARLLATLDANITFFDHSSTAGLAGCYFVNSFDSIGNESVAIDTVCAPTCPLYRLPNTFTPNGDGANDLFIPLAASFITQVEFSVFNRWGQKVFETNDPLLNWDGKNNDGNDLAEGTYFYVCNVFENVGAETPSGSILRGNIQLYR